MGTKRDVQDQRTRELIAASTKAGIELGFDRAVTLLAALEAAWGEDEAHANELRKMRAKTLGDMHKAIDEVAS